MPLAHKFVEQGGGSGIAVNIIDYLSGWLPVGSVGGGQTPPPCSQSANQLDSKS